MNNNLLDTFFFFKCCSLVFVISFINFTYCNENGESVKGQRSVLHGYSGGLRPTGLKISHSAVRT